MPIFTRILDFKRDFLARLRNQRKHPRFPVGASFPLKAALALAGTENINPDRAPVRGSGRSWSGRISDVSVNGLNILLPPAAATARGELSILHLTVENHELAIPCTVAHFRAFSSHAVCGVRLEFDDFPTQKAYRQLIEAVKLGASFASAGPGRRQTGFLRRNWRSTGRALLTEWREPASRALARFELTLGDHLVQGRSFPPGLEVLDRTDPMKSVAPAVGEEVRLLFRWITGNLPKNVPADLRELMSRTGSVFPSADQRAWPVPFTARAVTSTVIKVPPSTWRAPQSVPSAPSAN